MDGPTPIEYGMAQSQVPDALIPHKTFTGNRPSSSIMLPDLSAYTTGQILALYEHVTAAMVRQQLRAASPVETALKRCHAASQQT